MKFKELYLENKEHRYNTITRVKKENITLEMNPVKKIQDNWIILLGILVVIIGFLLINFNSKVFGISLVLIAFLVCVFIFGNKATIKCDKNTLDIKQGFQHNKIPYANLKSVFIGRATELFLVVPMYSYNIVIRYEDNFSLLRELEFSLMCADEEDVKNFISNFEVDKKINPRFITFEKRKFWGKLITSIIAAIIMIAIIMYIFRDVNWSNLI